MEAKTDTTLDVYSDLSYFFGPLPEPTACR